MNILFFTIHPVNRNMLSFNIKVLSRRMKNHLNYTVNNQLLVVLRFYNKYNLFHL